MFPIEKYKFFTNNKDLVIAEQTFAGKKYRGKAVCSSSDKFDLETGKKIAAAKCNAKICDARLKFAESRKAVYTFLNEQFENDKRRALAYLNLAKDEAFEAQQYLNEVLISNK